MARTKSTARKNASAPRLCSKTLPASGASRSQHTEAIVDHSSSTSHKDNATMSSVAPEHHGVHFFDLPQETLEMIYRLAYPCEETVWDKKQPCWGYVGRPSRVQGNVIHAQPFPHKIDDLLVSKAFFSIYTKLLRKTFKKGQTGGILARFAKVIVCHAADMSGYSSEHLPSAKVARLHIEGRALKRKGFGWHLDYTDDDLSNLNVFERISKMAGLTSLKLVFDKSSMELRPDRGRQVSRQNHERYYRLAVAVHRMQELLVPTVSRPSSLAAPAAKPIEDDEIPEYPAAFERFVLENRERMAAWVHDAKKAKKFAAWLQDPQEVKKAYPACSQVGICTA